MNIININQLKLPPPTNIQVNYTKNSGQCVINWDAFTAFDKPVYYNIYRSTAYTGIFYKLNKTPLMTNRFVDSIGSNPNIVYWYKISSLYQSEEGQWIEGKTSKPIQYEPRNTNIWFQKMNERNFWILKNDGILFDFYSRKYEGELCHCFDPIRGQAAAANCKTCFGTGFVGGFAPQCQLYIRLNLQQTSLNQSIESYEYIQQANGWTITNIMLHNRDVLIAPEGVIYAVLQTSTHNVNGYWLHTELSIKSYESQDPLYECLKRVKLKPAF